MRITKPEQFGVTLLSNGKFQARVTLDGKRHFLGNFTSKEGASEAVVTFLADNKIDRYSLLPESLLGGLHPTLNGESVIWPYKGSTRQLWWQCAECGHAWKAAAFQRTSPSHPSGCPECSRALKGRKLDQEEVEANFLARGFTLLERYTGSDDLLLIRHDKCGYEYATRYRTVVLDGHGCPRCARTGFDSSRPGYVYLLRVPSFRALKIGITNDPSSRLAKHANTFRHEVVQVWGPLDGKKAQGIERFVIAGWRSNNAAINAAMQAQFGMTETANTQDVDETSVVDIIDTLVKPAETYFDPSRYTVDFGCSAENEAFVRSLHYTSSLPLGLTLASLKDKGSLVGVAGFGACSYPGVAVSIWPEGSPSNTVELRRFILLDSLPANAGSWFLAKALRGLNPSVEVVVAFSDAGAGHHGGLYQASNFAYLGQTASSYHYEEVDGTFVHKRVVWESAKRRGTTERQQALDGKLVRCDDPPKHRYAMPLSRRARKLLLSAPYPKPGYH